MQEEACNLMLSTIKYQCCPHIEKSQLICTAIQLTGFYMRAKLALNLLNGTTEAAFLFILNLLNITSMLKTPSQYLGKIKFTIFNMIHNSVVIDESIIINN